MPKCVCGLGIYGWRVKLGEKAVVSGRKLSILDPEGGLESMELVVDVVGLIVVGILDILYDLLGGFLCNLCMSVEYCQVFGNLLSREVDHILHIWEVFRSNKMNVRTLDSCSIG